MTLVIEPESLAEDLTRRPHSAAGRQRKHRLPPVTGRPKVVLALQGGGALGAYHIGAYAALAEAGFEPDWITGISIGAVNAAILAGNPPGRRLEQLERFWNLIAWPDILGVSLDGSARRLLNTASHLQALCFGQPRFFVPRTAHPYLAVAGTVGATSFYDPAQLATTLAECLDFDLLNTSPVRVSLGATHVTSGSLVFFDNRRQRLEPEHVLASGALPPAFPAVRIDGELYWDGGCVANTPLQAVLSDPMAPAMLVFALDLWGADGAEPQTLDDVLWRQKQIQYASRTVAEIANSVQLYNMRRMISDAVERLPDAARSDLPQTNLAPGRIDVVHLVYQPGPDEIAQSDAEFSRPSLAERRAAGYAEMQRVLEAAPWADTTPPAHTAATIYHVERGRISSETPGV
jgi:NTE family protein